MARPKQSEELKRRHIITTRMTDSEYRRVTDDAERVGVSLSDYVRGKTLRGYVRVPKYAKIDSAHIGQLSKLGGLIKLTHNETGGIYRRETAAILEEIQGILVKIRHELERGDGNHDDRETHTEPQGT